MAHHATSCVYYPCNTSGRGHARGGSVSTRLDTPDPNEARRRWNAGVGIHLTTHHH